jgi:hypothetical protein
MGSRIGSWSHQSFIIEQERKQEDFFPLSLLWSRLHMGGLLLRIGCIAWTDATEIFEREQGISSFPFLSLLRFD